MIYEPRPVSPWSLLLLLCALGADAGEAVPAQAGDVFRPDEAGYIRHWLFSGRSATPYRGPKGGEGQMRKAAVKPVATTLPQEVALGAPAPDARKWQYLHPGANIFVECSTFSYGLEDLDAWSATTLRVPAPRRLHVRLWSAGTTDMWLDGRHAHRLDSPRYMQPSAQEIDLDLAAGDHAVILHLQALGIRDTRMLAGVQILSGGEGLTVLLPGPADDTRRIALWSRWLDSVRCADGRTLVAAAAPPTAVTVQGKGGKQTWPVGAASCPAPAEPQFTVALGAGAERMERLLVLPGQRKAVLDIAEGLSEPEHRLAHIRHIAAQTKVDTRSGPLALLAQRALTPGCPDGQDLLGKALTLIAGRPDCADFALASVLRLAILDQVTAPERERIKAVALAFRYWSDEEGQDAMCFGSENHSLLFHGCQLLAGRLWPDDTFAASHRTGREQVALATKRITAWLQEREAHGFDEYLSSTYMPITVAALLNLVDGTGDADLGRRASALIDRILGEAAMLSLDGVTVGPQGRVYGEVLYPQICGMQALLSWACPAAVPCPNLWLAGFATTAYHPPTGLAAALRKPVRTELGHHGVRIVVAKQPAWLLTSLAIPDGPLGLLPGQEGYQQHLWHATLGRDCHVFVNHPGASFDQSKSRPGYWYGNGTIPRTWQSGDILAQVYDIKPGHPIPWTHAHWPADAFDEQTREGNWCFGRRKDGYIALWCSAPLVPVDEVLTGRELRAQGRTVAWLCRCGSKQEHADLAAFRAACLRLAPSFDARTRALRLDDGRTVAWQ